jgi:CheY-like chemotaxis protein
MDNHLAGPVDGIEAALRIRAGSRVPIIFMTGYLRDEAFRERVRPVGPIACLDKPVIFEELLKALAEAFKA